MNPPDHVHENRTIRANRSQDKVIMWERHFSSIALAVLLGLMVWVGNSLTEDIDNNARTDERLKNIERDISNIQQEMRIRMADRFTGREAKDLIVILERRFKLHEDWQRDSSKWQKESEKRLDRLEIKVERITKRGGPGG